MRITVHKLSNRSLHLRLIREEDVDKKYPEYLLHSILEPIGDHGVELTGLSSSEYIKIGLKLALQEAKSQGYWYVVTTRIKNDNPIYKIYWL